MEKRNIPRELFILATIGLSIAMITVGAIYNTEELCKLGAGLFLIVAGATIAGWVLIVFS